jgi:hypothetical protein
MATVTPMARHGGDEPGRIVQQRARGRHVSGARHQRQAQLAETEDETGRRGQQQAVVGDDAVGGDVAVAHVDAGIVLERHALRLSCRSRREKNGGEAGRVARPLGPLGRRGRIPPAGSTAGALPPSAASNSAGGSRPSSAIRQRMCDCVAILARRCGGRSAPIGT